MNPKSPEARNRDDKPFEGMNISNTKCLNSLVSRSSCPVCGKSRMYFCYTCFVLVSQLEGKVPFCKTLDGKRTVVVSMAAHTNYDDSLAVQTLYHCFRDIFCSQLPIKVDIIKHKREIDGKSTAAHAAVLASEDVNIYTYPNVPEYENNGRTVLLYPGSEAISVNELFMDKRNSLKYSEYVLSELPHGYNVGTLMTKLFPSDSMNSNSIYHVEKLPVDRVVLIDSTWNQSRGIYADERLQRIPTIVLQKRASQFWRHQEGSPRWYLSTIEALHQLMLELHMCAWGCSENYKSNLTLEYPVHSTLEKHPQCEPYDGQYDNLLYFFKYMYEKLHVLYKHEDLLAYKRPMK